jgi:hypothetical protein
VRSCAVQAHSNTNRRGRSKESYLVCKLPCFGHCCCGNKFKWLDSWFVWKLLCILKYAASSWGQKETSQCTCKLSAPKSRHRGGCYHSHGKNCDIYSTYEGEIYFSVSKVTEKAFKQNKYWQKFYFCFYLEKICVTYITACQKVGQIASAIPADS